MSGPFDAFLSRAVSDCVNARRYAEAPKLPVPACRECEGTGRVAVHVCANKRECGRRCLSVQPCAACLGSGRCPTCDDKFQPGGSER